MKTNTKKAGAWYALVSAKRPSYNNPKEGFIEKDGKKYGYSDFVAGEYDTYLGFTLDPNNCDSHCVYAETEQEAFDMLTEDRQYLRNLVDKNGRHWFAAYKMSESQVKKYKKCNAHVADRFKDALGIDIEFTFRTGLFTKSTVKNIMSALERMGIMKPDL